MMARRIAKARTRWLGVLLGAMLAGTAASGAAAATCPFNSLRPSEPVMAPATVDTHGSIMIGGDPCARSFVSSSVWPCPRSA